MMLSAAVLAALFLGACATNHQMKPDVSFSGLKTYFIDAPQGGDAVLGQSGEREQWDAILVANIAETLNHDAYVRITDREKADMIFRPLWNTSISGNVVRDADIFGGPSLTTIGVQRLSSYCMLEIQIYFQNREDWVWRGFGPIMLSQDNLNDGTIANQVFWCLSEFPPERNPESMTVFRKDREAIAEGENSSVKDVVVTPTPSPDISKAALEAAKPDYAPPAGSSN